MKTYSKIGTRRTPQSQPIPGTTQVANSAGGFSFAVDMWKQLERFLILGTEGGTYYIGEQKLTADNATSVMKCIKQDGKRTVDTIVEISMAGRAPKNDPALFALAMATGVGDTATRIHAFEVLPAVARTGTHLFNFLTYMQNFRGWGKAARNGVSGWYTGKSNDRLAYQVIKYRQRGGWTHRDVLRKAHPNSESHRPLFQWITHGEESGELPRLIDGFTKAQNAKSGKEVAKLIADYNLPREAIPTEFLSDLNVWEALLANMPMTATIRNLGKMTAMGLLKPMSKNIDLVADRITNPSFLAKARVHPLSILVAMKTYEQGHGVRGSLTWSTIPQIVDALDTAFYESFKFIEPSGKNMLLALDVSGSMSWGEIAGMPGITPRIGSAAMAMVTARTEKNWHVMGFSHTLVSLAISPRQRLDDVIRVIKRTRMGGTNCALPMIYAKDNNLEVDTFVVYTDSETWCGGLHPVQALTEYREKSGRPAKLVVVAMLANPFSIADPNDAGMLDVVGFDTATPNIISDFARS